MATCEECNKKIGILEYSTSVDGRILCRDCEIKLGKEFLREKKAKEAVHQQQAADIAQEIEAILLTTETAPNLNITKRIEIITAEVAFGMHIFKDLFAGIRDIVGGRSEAIQKTMRDSRRTALYELKKEAHAVGANAVVGVDLNYVELSGAGSMVMLVASGTAVVIEV
jgi:uncharacterized protein YbjQ (UPF0145 family)